MLDQLEEDCGKRVALATRKEFCEQIATFRESGRIAYSAPFAEWVCCFGSVLTDGLTQQMGQRFRSLTDCISGRVEVGAYQFEFCNDVDRGRVYIDWLKIRKMEPRG